MGVIPCIGYEIAKQIAMMGAHVIIACRSVERAKEAIQRMKAEFVEEKGKDNTVALSVEFMHLDLSSLTSVVGFVDSFKLSGRKLQTLVCNAGIGMHRQAYTEDDNEIHFQILHLEEKKTTVPTGCLSYRVLIIKVNYLGLLLLTIKLLPTMKQSGDDCRIVNLTSSMYTSSNWKLDEIQGRSYSTDKFDRILYYTRSKAYQIMQMYFMGEKLAKTCISIACVYPGVVKTEVTKNMEDMKGLMCIIRCIRVFAGKIPLEGAISSINAAVNPKLKGVRNVYFENTMAKRTVSFVRNKAHQQQLWDYSLKMLKDHVSEADLQVFDN